MRDSFLWWDLVATAEFEGTRDRKGWSGMSRAQSALASYNLTPLFAGQPRHRPGEAVPIQADTIRRCVLPAWAMALRMKWTRQRCTGENQRNRLSNYR